MDQGSIRRGGTETPGLTRVWLVTGAAIGVFDILDAFLFFGIRSGAPPGRILQSIAAGLLGREAAIAGGGPTMILGGALHFFNALVIAGVYLLASRRLPVLARHWVGLGMLYGLVVYGVMNFVVIPLSAINGGGLPPTPVLVNGLLIHLLGVGLVAGAGAHWARRS